MRPNTERYKTGLLSLYADLTSDTATDKDFLLLEDELRSLSSNSTNIDDILDSQDNAVIAERRATSGRRYSANRNATTTGTESGRSRTRTRFRQRPGGARRPGGRQRWKNRGRKFRGKGKNRMTNREINKGNSRNPEIEKKSVEKIQGTRKFESWWKNRGPKFRGKGKNRMRTGAGFSSGRRLKSKNPTKAPPDREQSDATYNAPPKSVVGASSLVEGQEEMTNTLDQGYGQQNRPRLPDQCLQMRCQRGGYCIMEDRQGTSHARCQCPLGTKGHLCETGLYSLYTVGH